MKQNIYLASSKGLIVLVIALHLICALGLFVANIPYWLAALFTIPLFLHAKYVVQLHGLRQHKNSVTVLCQDCEYWQYALYSGRTCKGTLLKKSSYRSSVVLILFMQHFNGFRYVIIPRDSLSKHQYRYLAYCLSC